MSAVTTTPTSLPWLYEKGTGVRVVSGISSSLSIIGSALIILSYICFRSLRTRARLILVHLALTDMGVGLSNLAGIIANFDRFYEHHHSRDETEPYKPNMTIDILCKAQAFTAHYCTLSSVLWTICLAVYMYMLIMSQKQLKQLLWFFYILCYGMPMLVTGWMMWTQRLGFSPYDSSGWCSIIAKRPFMEHEVLVSKVDLVSTIFGYDLWIFLTIALIVVLYISVYSYVKLRYEELKNDADAKVYLQAMYNIDYKFIVIPLMFIFLRIWSLITDTLLIYIQIPSDEIPQWIMKALLYMGGMGDSGQGFINAILFVAFTHSVRKRLLACICCKWWKVRKQQLKEVNSVDIKSKSRIFKSSDPIAYESKRYSTLPQGEEVVNSASETQSFSPISDYSPVSFK